VRPREIFRSEEEAVTVAKDDLHAAFSRRVELQSELAVAEMLRSRGYIRVEQFKLA
jgi:hypothetical protein